MHKMTEGVDFVLCSVCRRVLLPGDVEHLGRCVRCRRKPVPEAPIVVEPSNVATSVEVETVEGETGPTAGEDSPESTNGDLEVRHQGADAGASPVEPAGAVSHFGTRRSGW